MKIDGMARSSDIAAIGYNTIKFTEEKISFQYWYTKETKEQTWVPMFINASTTDIDTCTVRAVKEYMARTKDCKREKKKIGKDEDKDIFRPLFIKTVKKKDQYEALGIEAIAKSTKNVLDECGVNANGENWTSHSIRGASSSKAYNLGCDITRICNRARWANSDTFMQNYYKQCTYKEYSQHNKFEPIEMLLRMKTTRVE